jgi:hypothetical protein
MSLERAALPTALTVPTTVIATYAALVAESATHAASTAPHWPLAVLVGLTWNAGPLAAILGGAAIGLGCDAIAAGAIGPGLCACVLASVVAYTIRERRSLQSLLAFVLWSYAFGVSALLGKNAAHNVLEHRGPLAGDPILPTLSRAVATSMLCAAILVGARLLRRIQRLATALS